MKKYLLPSIFFIFFSLVIASIVLVFNGVKGELNEKPTYKYTLDNVFMSDVMNVVSEVNDNFIKPYVDEKVTIQRSFYNKDNELDKQEKSIIYYENTYIQNKGVDYTSSNAFDVVKTQLVLSLAITEEPMPAEGYGNDRGRAGEGY